MILTLLGLAGCAFNPLGSPTAVFSTSIVTTITPEATVSTLPSPTSPAPTGTSTPSNPSVVRLILWLPPEFDPQSGSTADNLLAERLTSFSEIHPEVTFDVRIKAQNGPSNLIDSLSAASAAAPQALPDLMLLSRPDIETAALKGLLSPLDHLTTLPQNPDWYPYARQLMQVQDQTFDLPFAGDALVILYRPSVLGNSMKDWASFLALHTPLVFPVGDTQALFPLALYLSAGGELNNDRGRPILQTDPLTTVFSFYARGARGGTFPYWISDVSQADAAWQVYHEQRTQMAVGWTSNYLTGLPEDTSVLPIPSLQTTPVTIATGWGWAFPEYKKENRAIALTLAEYLMDNGFQGRWTEAAGYLPTRTSALTSWQNKSVQAAIEPVIMEARGVPENDILAGISLILTDYTRQVIQGLVDPQTAAQEVIKRLGSP